MRLCCIHCLCYTQYRHQLAQWTQNERNANGRKTWHRTRERHAGAIETVRKRTRWRRTAGETRLTKTGHDKLLRPSLCAMVASGGLGIKTRPIANGRKSAGAKKTFPLSKLVCPPPRIPKTVMALHSVRRGESGEIIWCYKMLCSWCWLYGKCRETCSWCAAATTMTVLWSW